MLATTLGVLSNGKRLRTACLGSGPPLVLLHGYPDNLQLFSRLAPALAADCDVRAFDWPGMGASEEWSGGASPVQMAERLIAILDHWKIERADLVGFDMGGQPALVAAARFPARVRRLVVMNSLVLGDERTSWEIALLRRTGFNRRILEHLPRLVFARAERTFLPRGTRLDPELREDLWRHFRAPEVRRYISRMCAGYQGALRSLPRVYAEVRCPTLVLWGERDRHFPPIQAERLGAIVPGARVDVIPEAEHWMPWYLAERVAERMRAFLST